MADHVRRLVARLRCRWAGGHDFTQCRSVARHDIHGIPIRAVTFERRCLRCGHQEAPRG